MRAVLIDESAPVYAQVEDQSISITTLHKGDEFELTKTVRKKGTTWVGVKLDSGSSGFIDGNTQIYRLKKVELILDTVNMYAEPSAESAVQKTLSKGSIFQTLKVEKKDDEAWVKVRDSAGAVGYINGTTRIRIIPENARADAKRTIYYGLALTVIGIIFAVVAVVSKQSTGTYYLAMGFIIFGVMQLMQGFIQRRRAIRQEEREKSGQ